MAVVVNTYLGEVFYLSDVGETDHDAFFTSASAVSIADFTKIGVFSDDSSLKVTKDGEVATSDGKSITFGYKSDVALPIIAQDSTVVSAFEARTATVEYSCLLIKYTNRTGGLLIRPNAWIIEEDYVFGKNAGSKFTITGSTKGQAKSELRKEVTITA